MQTCPAPTEISTQSASDVPKCPDQTYTENSWQKKYAQFLYRKTIQKPFIHLDVPSPQEEMPLILVTEKKTDK